MHSIYKIVTYITLFSFIFVGFGSPTAQAQTDADLSTGTVIKGKSSTSLYYIGEDGKRHIFPNSQTYHSWYDDFSSVVEVEDNELANYVIGSNIRYKPGVLLVKIQSDPKVYAVSANGLLRWIKSEGIARDLYGDNWNLMVDDVPVSFFTNYSIGASVESSDDFDPDEEEEMVDEIDENKIKDKDERMNRYNKRLARLKARIHRAQDRLCNQFERRYKRLTKRFERRGLDAPELPQGFIERCKAGDNDEDGDDGDSRDDIFKGRKVFICHQTSSGASHTIRVSKAAGRAHISHGDTLGKCEGDDGNGDDNQDDNNDDTPDDTTSPVISSVVATPAATSTVVTWTTDEVATSKVVFADSSLDTASTTDMVSDAAFVTSHSIELTGLATSTLYYFRVESEDESGNVATSTESTFTTL